VNAEEVMARPAAASKEGASKVEKKFFMLINTYKLEWEGSLCT